MDELIKSIHELIKEIHELTIAVKSLLPVSNDIADASLSEGDEEDFMTYLDGTKIAK